MSNRKKRKDGGKKGEEKELKKASH